MASRWMQGVKARDRFHRRRQGNASLTGYQQFIIREDEKGVPRKTLTREQRFYLPKMNETPEGHIERMREEASWEQLRATEWWRRLARVLLGIGGGDIDSIEREIIMRSAREGRSVQDAQASILRYRKLTGWKAPLTKEQEKARRRKLAEERRCNKPEDAKKPKQKVPPKPRGSGFLINLD
jgi:hypothetical protein